MSFLFKKRIERDAALCRSINSSGGRDAISLEESSKSKFGEGRILRLKAGKKTGGVCGGTGFRDSVVWGTHQNGF